jgi:addiction module HigA family antidote
MSNGARHQYDPDTISPPGETLEETLAAIGMSQVELARRTGRPLKTINEIIKGKTAITPETALQFERVLGIPASFWNNREREYRDVLARIADRECLRKSLELLKKIPVNAMIKLGWIARRPDKIEQLQEVLAFFGVASPELDVVPAAFRKSPAYESDPFALAAWLRKGEIEAARIRCSPFDEDFFRVALGKVRQITTDPPRDFVPETQRLCADSGVAVVFVPELPRTRAHGATRWLGPDKALIQLSLRYKSDDMLWFTFFHEAGHILLHGKRDAFLEGDGSNGKKEAEANRFAEQMLIPDEDLQRFIDSGQKSLTAIERFAKQLRIAPGIVVGRLQHEGYLPKSHGNGLKRRYEWTVAARG